MLFTAVVLLHAFTIAQAVETSPGGKILDLGFLQGKEALTSPQPTQAFSPPDNSVSPKNTFEGILTLETDAQLNRIEILVDTFGASVNNTLKLRELPPYSFSLVMDGAEIIPLSRGPQRSDHPYWEMIPGPGISWDVPADKGWSRASLPFALKEKNQNCTHNGLMTFMYKDSGEITRVAWQITSETCLYLKINLWGVVDANYEPRAIPQSAGVITAHHKVKVSRLPVRPFSALEKYHPELDQTAFHPPGIDDNTVYGFILNGIHYRSDCPTRFGPYPFCEALDLPSYSLAKSLVGGLGYFMLTSRWPEFATIPVSRLIPECKLTDNRWDDVTPGHLLNMTTGNYNSKTFNADEDDAVMQNFFLAESHKDKVRFSCEAWTRKSPPGTQWVYNTTNTYLLGVAMDAFLKQKSGPQADIYRNLVYEQFFKPLNISPSLKWTQRTYDEVMQVFTGFGLIFYSDDVARIAQSLNAASPPVTSISGADFDLAMLRAGKPKSTRLNEQDLAYSNGFWGVDVSQWIACPGETWVSFMSGYGGISVAMFPNNSVYYYFTDSNQYGFRKAAVEANKPLNYCKES